MEPKIENALNEARIMVLVAQVLLGFGFQSVFQTAFEKLPLAAQYLKLADIGLLLLALALFITPAAYHQIVERGELNPRLQRFVSGAVCPALFPFALTFGGEIAIALGKVYGGLLAGIGGGLIVLIALFFWYGIGLYARRGAAKKQGDTGMATETEQKPTPLEQKIKFALTETRVVLPGAQALLGFQLAAVLMDGFAKLPGELKTIHLVGLMLIAVSAALLMAPAAFHRIAEAGENTERVYRFTVKMLLAAMVLLALGIGADVVVLFQKVTHSPLLAWSVTGVSLLCFYGLWFGYTLLIRARSTRERGSTPGNRLHPAQAR